MVNLKATTEFMKDFKKLCKKYNFFDEDFERFKKAILVESTSLTGLERISGLGNEIKIPVYKARKFRCKSLNKGSKSGIRVILAFDEEDIIFCEAYCKNKKPLEDKERIKKYFGCDYCKSDFLDFK